MVGGSGDVYDMSSICSRGGRGLNVERVHAPLSQGKCVGGREDADVVQNSFNI